MDGLLSTLTQNQSQKTVDLKGQLSYTKVVGRGTTMSPYKCVAIH